MTPSLLSPVRAAEESPRLEWGHDVKTLARSSQLRGLEGLRALCCCSPVLGALAGSQPCKQSRVVQSPALVQLEQKEISSGLAFMQLEAAFGSEQADAAGGAAL